MAKYKVPAMKYKCDCGFETRLKPILLGFQVHCRQCGKKYNHDEVITDVQRQKLIRNNSTI